MTNIDLKTRKEINLDEGSDTEKEVSDDSLDMIVPAMPSGESCLVDGEMDHAGIQSVPAGVQASQKLAQSKLPGDNKTMGKL